MKITVYSDPGHGWAKVPKALLNKLGISDKITRYSYQRGEHAYLEEDCDLATLITALKERNIGYSFREQVAGHRQSKIRSYEQYRA